MLISCHSYFFTLILGLILSFTPIAHANSNFEGLFSDIGFGYRDINTSMSSSLTINGTTVPSALSVGQPSRAVAVFTGGYNFPIALGYILGVGANISPASGQQQEVQVQALNQSISLTGIKPLYNYGFFLSPGFKTKDGLIYFKVGKQTQVVNSNTGTNFNGYLVGLGYKQFIYDSIYLFGEANYSSYDAQTTTRTIISAGRTINSSITASLQTTRLLVGLGYQF